MRAVQVRDRPDDVAGKVENLHHVPRRTGHENVATGVIDNHRAEADRPEICARSGNGWRHGRKHHDAHSGEKAVWTI